MKKSLPALLLVLAACNRPPGDHVVAINPAEPTAADDLMAVTPTPASDPNGDTVSYLFAWSVDGSAWGTDQVVPAAETSKGQTWQVEVTPTDGKKEGDPATASVVIGNTPPVVLAVSFDPEVPGVEDDVSLVIEAEDTDDDAVSYRVAWSVDGLETDYEGQTLTASATSKGERWTAIVVPFDDEDEGEPFEAEVDIDNTAPVMLTLTLSPTEDAHEGTVFKAEATAEDADGDELTFVYSFLVNGEVVREASQASLAGSYFNRGDTVGVSAIANDGYVDSEPLSADETVLVGNSVPTLAGVKVDPATVYEATVATCRTTNWEDLDPLDFEANHFTWYVNSVSVGTEQTLTGDSFDKHDSIWCSAIPYDEESEGEEAVSAPVEVDNTAPSIASVTLNTTSPTRSEVLTATINGAQDDDDDGFEFSYQWVVSGTVTATTETLDGDSFSRGDTVYVLVTPTDDEGLAGSAVKSDVATVVNGVPVVSNLVLGPDPAFTDNAVIATFDAEDPDGDTITYAYSWTIDGTVDSATTTDTMAKGQHSKGKEIGLTVTPTDSEGDSGAVVTASPLTISNSTPTFNSAAITPTTATVADTLTCVMSGWKDTDDDPEDYQIQWTAGTVTLGTATTLDGTDFTRGDSVVCTATAWDGEDTGDVRSSSSLSIDNAVPVVSSVSISPSVAYETTVLTASAVGTDEDPADTVTFDYKWYVDGVLRGTGTQLTGSDFDRDDKVFLRATPTDGTDTGAYKLTNVTISNSIPSVSTVSVSPASPITTDVLTVTVTGSDDDDGDTITYSYVWLVDGSAVLTSTVNTLAASYTAKDEVVGLTVTPSDGTAIGATTTVTAAVTIQNSPPSQPSVSLAPALPMVNVHDLICSVDTESEDADGDTITYDFAWTQNSGGWSGSVATSTWGGDLVDATDLSEGDLWSCTVTPNDGDEDGDSDTTDTVTVLPECDNSATWTDTDYVGGTNSRGVTVYDVDEDGADDVAFGNVGDSTVQIYFGDGSGGFGSYSTISVGGASRNPTFGDYTGDGNVDMVTSSQTADKLYLVEGLGGGTFKTAFTNVTQASAPTWLDMADIDGDGDLDLLVSLATSNCIARRLNSSGSFGSATCVISGVSSRPVGGDFDNDGQDEVAYISGGAITVVEFNGSGNFLSSTTLTTSALTTVSSVSAYDIDDDGDDDLLAFGTGSGGTALVSYLDYYDDYASLTECAVGDGLSEGGLAAGDFDDDGVPDFATASICNACASTYTTWLND